MANLSDHLTSAAEAAKELERTELADSDQQEYDRLRKLAEDMDLEVWVLKDYVEAYDD